LERPSPAEQGFPQGGRFSAPLQENLFLLHVTAAALQRYAACAALPSGAAGTGFYDLKFKAAFLAMKHLTLFHL
jgi:hypothetical protein